MTDKLKNAVALRYDPEKEGAPRVVAQGKGEIAERIQQIGKEHGIPVYEDPELAQAISEVDLGMEIPVELYQIVAEVLVFVKGLKEKAPGSLKK